ncbi:hypothetical protein G9A89_019048 [Geosiphon pyriformis]|nr:hypothetical protein G9A89_019048 [Geosiphon pyriformis]
MVNIPRVPLFCFFAPLRIGAFIVALWMFAWNAFTGFSVMFTSYGGSIGFLWKGMGVAYIAVAAASIFGAHAIYHEIPARVALFVKIFVANIIFYFVASVSFVVAVSLIVSSEHNKAVKACEAAQVNLDSKINCNIGYVGYPIFGWLVPFMIGILFQVYFAICIRSYSLELQERENDKSPNYKNEMTA